jgi:hypothetical protein
MEDYFENVFVSSWINYFCVIISLLSIFINTSALYFIIRYERCCSHVRRNVLSKLFSSACASGVKWFVICQALDLVRFAYGPLPQLVCLFHVTYKNIVFMEIFMFYCMATVFRWILIFKIKTLQGFNDDFWAKFTALWVSGTCVLFQSVFTLSPGRQPVNFYICSGEAPEMTLPPKFNPTASLLPFLTILVQVVIHFRIYFYKRAIKVGPKAAFPIQDLKTIDQDSITVFSGRLVNLLTLSFSTFLIAKVNSLSPETLRVYPMSLYINLLLFIAPSVAGICPFIYVILNKSMRRFILSELRV